MKQLFILILMISNTNVFCQSYFAEKHTNVEYLGFGQKEFLSKYTSFSVKVKDDVNIDQQNISTAEESYISSAIQIEGLEQVANGGDLSFLIEFKKLKIDHSTKLKDESYDYFDQLVSEFIIQYNSQFDYKYSIIDNKTDKTIVKGKPSYAGTFRKQEVGPFQGGDNCQWWLDTFHDNHMHSVVEDAYNFAIRDIQLDLLKREGYTLKSDYATFYYAPKEQKQSYPRWTEALDLAEKVAENISYQSLDYAKELAAKPIAIWEDLLANTPSTEKAIRYHLLDNLTTIHFWLENFETSKSYALKIVENGYKNKKGKDWLLKISEITTDLKLGKISSNHSDKILANNTIFEWLPKSKEREEAIANNELTQLVEFNQFTNKKEHTQFTEGTIVFEDGRKQSGLFAYFSPRSNGNHPLFFGKNKLKLCLMKRGLVYTIKPNYEVIDSIFIGDKSYAKKNISIGPWTAYNAITFLEHSTEKSDLISYFTKDEEYNIAFTHLDDIANLVSDIDETLTGEDNINAVLKYLIYHHENERYYRLEENPGTSKRFAIAYPFEDCETLYEEITSSDLTNVNIRDYLISKINEYQACKE